MKKIICLLLLNIPYNYGAAHISSDDKSAKEEKDGTLMPEALPGESKKLKEPKVTMDFSGKCEFQISFRIKDETLPVFIDRFKGKDIGNVYFKDVIMIGKYADPYNFLPKIVLVENNPKMLESIVPDDLLKALAAYFEVDLKALDKKTFFEAFMESINFNTIVFGNPVLAKPIDKIYNIVFHPVMRSWAAGPSVDEHNLLKSVNLGLFSANGVTELSKENNGIAFGYLRPEAISIHPAAGGGLAFSPNNVRFKINTGRSIVSFWTLAVSPEKKKNANISLNYIIDSADLEDKICKKISKCDDVNSLINLFDSEAKDLKNPADKSTLDTFGNNLRKMLKSIEKPAIERLFSDNSFNNSLGAFPITVIDSDIKLNLFQIAVASQYKAGITSAIFGNTCGRHSIKNGIAALKLIAAYNSRNSKEFINYATWLSKIEGNEKVVCIFDYINKELETLRKISGAAIKSCLLTTEELDYINTNIKKIADSCSISSINKDSFSIFNSDFILAADSIESLAIDETLNLKIKEFAKILDRFKQKPEYQHIFFLGISEPAGPHWFVVQAIQANNKLKFIVYDSLNNKNRIKEPVVVKLIKLLNSKPYNLDDVNGYLLSKKINEKYLDIKNEFKKTSNISNELSKETTIKKLFFKLAELLVKFDNESSSSTNLTESYKKILDSLREAIVNDLVNTNIINSLNISEVVYKRLLEPLKILGQTTNEYNKSKKGQEYLELNRAILN